MVGAKDVTSGVSQVGQARELWQRASGRQITPFPDAFSGSEKVPPPMVGTYLNVEGSS